MRSGSINQQRGATFLGTLTIVAILGLALYAGIRLVPKYVDYFAVVGIMKRVASDLKDGSPTPADVRRSLETKWVTDYVYDVQPSDIEISPAPGGLEMHAQYRAEAPFIGNISLVVDFDKSVLIPSGSRGP